MMVAPAAPPPIQVEPPPTGARYGAVAIPAIEVRAPIRQLPLRGTGERVLARGVGHLPSTYGPGMDGTIALFGHNVTPTLGLPQGPFHEIDQLERGDRVVVRMPYGRYVYSVRGKRLVEADAWEAFRPKLGSETLLLAKCWPDWDDTHRLVVRAVR